MQARAPSTSTHNTTITPSSSLAARTHYEYARVLDVALVSGQLDLGRVETWSASRRGVLRAALRWRGLNIEVPRAPRQKRRHLPVPVDGELARVEAAAAQLPRGDRVLALLPLALGLRAQEVVGLTREAVQRAVDVGELVLLRKGGEEQMLPIDHAKGLLRELLDTAARAGGHWKIVREILTAAGGAHTAYCRLRHLVRRVARLAQLRVLRPHLLRHAFATRMFNDGAPLSVVQAWLGHRNLATTLRYLHLSPAAMKRHMPRPVELP